MPELKIRSPFGVWALSFVTIGVYAFVWVAKTCREVQAVNPSNPKNVNGSSAVLSMIFGGFTLLIWPIINWFKFCDSVRAEQQAVGLPVTFNTGVATLCYFLAGTHSCYVQSQRNLVVHAVRQRQGTPA